MKDNLATLVTEHHRNIQQQMLRPFLPPPPPLRLSQQKPALELTPAYNNSLEQSYIAAKNAATMAKIQTNLNAHLPSVKV